MDIRLKIAPKWQSQEILIGYMNLHPEIKIINNFPFESSYYECTRCGSCISLKYKHPYGALVHRGECKIAAVNQGLYVYTVRWE
jgi:hypothetical protein